MMWGPLDKQNPERRRDYGQAGDEEPNEGSAIEGIDVYRKVGCGHVERNYQLPDQCP